MTSPAKKAAQVALVGAGPGEPGWITVRGLELLRRADVVVYDALANAALLDEVPPEAEKIDVGKRAGAHKRTQEQINALLVDKARPGRLVVRLKGGDPYLFGRGAEEAIHLSKHGITCEVVPGITAGLAAPLAAGIPVTHRELASTLTLVTGHEDPAKADAGQTALDYGALARLAAAGGTLCFYMGMGRLALIAEELQRHGLAGDTPAALVQWGGTPRQKSVRTTLARAAADAQRAGLGAPAIVVVGRVAALAEPGLEFFTRRPLFGQRIVVTRTRPQASELRARLAERGAEVLEAPTIELAPPPDQAAIDCALRQLGGFDWLVLTSANAVAALAERMEHLALDARHLAGVKLAAVGEATARELRQRLAVRPDCLPGRFVAEALADELIARHEVCGRRFLLLRADLGRPVLAQRLADAGATVTDLALYRTRPVAALPPRVLDALREGRIDWLTFTSASTARNLAELLGAEKPLLANVKIASIGPMTSEAVRELGLKVMVQAAQSTVEALVEALEKAQSELE